MTAAVEGMEAAATIGMAGTAMGAVFRAEMDGAMADGAAVVVAAARFPKVVML